MGGAPGPFSPQPEPVSQEGTVLAEGWPEEILALEDVIIQAAQEAGLDPDLLAAKIKKESWFSVEWCPKNRPDRWDEPGSRHYQACSTAWELCPNGPSTSSCTSRAGAIGPAQVMPYHFGPGENPRDLLTNITKGAEILADYTSRKGGDAKGGLAAYYCGPNRTLYTPDCFAYAEEILGWYEKATEEPK